MAVSFLRLRLTLLANALRIRTRTDRIRIISFGVAVVIAALLTWLSVALAALEDFAMADYDSSVSLIIVLFAVLVPFLSAGRFMTAGQFTTFPFTPGQVATRLIVTSVVSWTSLSLIVWLVVTSMFHATDGVSVALSVVGVLCFLAMLQLIAHIAAQGGEHIFCTPQRRVVQTLIGWMLSISAAPLLFFLVGTHGITGFATAMTEIGNVVEWTPIGAALSAADTYRTDGLWLAVAKLGISNVTVFTLAWAWRSQVRFTFSHVARPGQPVVAKSGLGWFERFPATATGVIAARSAISWIRDQRYRTSFYAVPAVIVIGTLATWIAGAPSTIVWTVPLAVTCFFLGWSVHNDVSHDATAFWIHVATDTKGSADRVGRIAPVLLVGIPVIIVGSTFALALMGDWRPLPAIIGICSSLLLTSAGVSSYASARWPYPTARPGDGIFVQPQFAGSGAVRSQSLTVIATLVLSLPALVLGYVGIDAEVLVLQMLSLLFGVVGGALVLAIGVSRGAAAYDDAGPELLSLNQVFD